MDEPRPWLTNVPRPCPMNVPPLWWPWPLVLRFGTSPCSYCNPSKLGCHSSARSKSAQVAHIGCRGWLAGSHALERISVFSSLSKRHRHRWSYRPKVKSVFWVQSVFWGEPRAMLVWLLVLVLLVWLLVLVPMWWLEQEVPLLWMGEVPLWRMWEVPLPTRMRQVPLPTRMKQVPLPTRMQQVRLPTRGGGPLPRRGPICPPFSEPASVGIPMLRLSVVGVVLLPCLPG